MRARTFIAVSLVLSVVIGTSAVAAGAGSRPPAKRSSARHVGKREGILAAAGTRTLESDLVPTNRGDDSRDGWYPDQPLLSPTVVGSSDFGEVFKKQLNGQIYAQPLLVGHVLIVATETDWVYGIDPLTGAVKWSRKIGTPFRDASLGCNDLTPDLGVTSTPTVDPTTGVVYLVDQAFAGGKIEWFMNAIRSTTGSEMPGFPVEIKGPPDNNPLQPFVPTKEMQRPGLLLLGHVVYAAFGSHCDFAPYTGIVVGVSTSGRQTTMWDVEGAKGGGGGGIWQAGGGLVSDGPNQILLSTANGYGVTLSHPVRPTPGSSPPADLADSVVRLVVQPNGSLIAKDFFSMTNDASVDAHDWDLAGAPVALPSEFSTPKYPHLLVATGKEGVVYLLNRDNLGGAGEGPGGKDMALGEYGPNGEAISTAGAWPGNGGYVYVSTLQSASGGAGKVDVYKFTTTPKGLPGLHLVGVGSQPAVFGVSGPIVTSDGITSGSATVWVVNGAALQAYDAVPVHGQLKLLGTWAIGNGTPFNPPGVGNGMVYVGDLGGTLYGFGKTGAPNVAAAVKGDTSTGAIER